MAGGRKPGLWGLHPADIEDGTFARAESPLPGLLGGASSMSSVELSPLTSPPVYEEDVHLNLTGALALVAGFDIDAANLIAVWAQKVDDLPSMTPMPLGLWDEVSGAGVERRRLWHFTTPERRADLQRQYEASGELSDLGIFMHVWQDQYSHADMGPVFGHMLTKVDRRTGNARRPTLAEIAVMLSGPTLLLTTGDLSRLYEQWRILFERTWHETDDPSKSPDKAYTMARTSFEKLRDAAALFFNKGAILRKFGAAWTPQINELVWTFCRDSSKSGRVKTAARIGQTALNTQGMVKQPGNQNTPNHNRARTRARHGRHPRRRP